jgi:hypothetical protein
VIKGGPELILTCIRPTLPTLTKSGFQHLVTNYLSCLVDEKVLGTNIGSKHYKKMCETILLSK